MTAALALPVLASTALAFGLYYMKRQAERLPSLGGGWRLSAWLAFLSDPLWLFGLLLQVAGYAFYLLALRWAPLSIVHTALNGGIALFVVLAVIGLHEHVRRLEWIGVGAVTAGLVALGASGSLAAVASSPPRATGPFAAGLVAAALAALWCDRTPRRAIGLSVASGFVLGLAGIYAKRLAEAASFATALGSPDLLLTLATNLIGFALMQAALQAGRGVVVVPIFSTLSNLVPIIGGIVLFGEALPANGAAALLRPLAFLLALGGAALLAAVGEMPDP